MTKKQKVEVPWYAEEAGFFGPAYLREYTDYISSETTLAQVDFLEKALSLKPGLKILDCPCGHGRHSIELVRRGYDVTGQDLNAFFLEKAQKDAERARVSVRWVKGDMRDVPFENEFDVAVNMFTAFGYFDSDDENRKSLEQVSKALKHGGRFILDVINRDRIIRTYREKDWQELPDGTVITIDRTFDHARGQNIERRVRIFKNGKREELTTIRLRLYTVAELTNMLAKSGLTLKETFGDFNCDLLTFDSKRCILLAQKP